MREVIHYDGLGCLRNRAALVLSGGILLVRLLKFHYKSISVSVYIARILFYTIKNGRKNQNAL